MPKLILVACRIKIEDEDHYVYIKGVLAEIGYDVSKIKYSGQPCVLCFENGSLLLQNKGREFSRTDARYSGHPLKVVGSIFLNDGIKKIKKQKNRLEIIASKDEDKLYFLDAHAAVEWLGRGATSSIYRAVVSGKIAYGYKWSYKIRR